MANYQWQMAIEIPMIQYSIRPRSWHSYFSFNTVPVSVLFTPLEIRCDQGIVAKIYEFLDEALVASAAALPHQKHSPKQ
jgi:hypothetical protein